jgi:hypothetical protein
MRSVDRYHIILYPISLLCGGRLKPFLAVLERHGHMFLPAKHDASLSFSVGRVDMSKNGAIQGP